MRQYAWLELDRGMWYLLTDANDDPHGSPRKWADKNAALADLREEGWIITGPHPKQHRAKKHSRTRFCGYGLMRIIH